MKILPRNADVVSLVQWLFAGPFGKGGREYLINVRSIGRGCLFFGYFAADGTGFVPS